jgi:hypothetical protein
MLTYKYDAVIKSTDTSDEMLLDLNALSLLFYMRTAGMEGSRNSREDYHPHIV